MGKVFFTKDKHNILNFVVIGAICLIGYGVIYWLQSMVTYQSDDYYYATFWRDGLLHFIQNSIDHFQGYNGRVLVHFVAQTVLAFDLHVYAVLNTILLFSLAILGCYVIGVSQFRRKERFLCVGIFAVFLFLLGRDVWRDSLLWISASYNYMFPVFLFFLSLFVQTRYLSCKNHCPAATILLIAVNFFCRRDDRTVRNYDATGIVHRVFLCSYLKKDKMEAGFDCSLYELSWSHDNISVPCHSSSSRTIR